MSMASYEPDRDYGDEVIYEESRSRLSDLCEVCLNDVVVEGEDLCRACLTEIEADLDEIEEPSA
jgi:hypothetical protein